MEYNICTMEWRLARCLRSIRWLCSSLQKPWLRFVSFCEASCTSLCILPRCSCKTLIVSVLSRRLLSAVPRCFCRRSISAANALLAWFENAGRNIELSSSSAIFCQRQVNFWIPLRAKSIVFEWLLRSPNGFCLCLEACVWGRTCFLIYNTWSLVPQEWLPGAQKFEFLLREFQKRQVLGRFTSPCTAICSIASLQQIAMSHMIRLLSYKRVPVALSAEPPSPISCGEVYSVMPGSSNETNLKSQQNLAYISS